MKSNLLRCPACKGNLVELAPCIGCANCGAEYNSVNGIIDFLSPYLGKGGKHQEVVHANQKLHDALGVAYEHDPLIKQQFGYHSNCRMKEVFTDIVQERRKASSLDVSLVDLGTGTGLILDLTEGMFDKTLGFDVSSQMLLSAKKRGHQVHMADACRLPLANDSVDVVSLDSVLHHIYSVSTVIEEAYRVLKPGGFLVTDWDPNGFCMDVQRGHIYRFILWASKNIRYFLSSHQNSTDCKTFELAEYHRFYGNIDPETLSKKLQSTGFYPVRLIFHGNNKTVTRFSIFDMPAISIVRSLFMMALGLTFDKKLILEILMTISRKPDQVTYRE